MEANYTISEKCVVPEEWKAGIGHDFRHYKGKLKHVEANTMPLSLRKIVRTGTPHSRWLTCNCRTGG